ncbi:hypothetical protein Tco_0035102 [Tanacetum coccineum]
MFLWWPVAVKEGFKDDADKDLKIIEAQTHLHIRNQEQNQRKYKQCMEEDWKVLNKKLKLKELEVKQVDIKLGEDC